MLLLNSIRQNLRSFLRIPENFSPAASASLPTALGGSPPEMSLIRRASVAPSASAAPVAARPTRIVASPGQHDTFRLYEEQLKLDFDLASKLALASTPNANSQIRAAFAQFRASKLRGKTMADIGKMTFALKPRAATVDTDHEPIQDGVPQPRPADSLGDIVKQLEQCLDQLKQLNPGIEADDADADADAAKACSARGDSAGALRRYDAAISKLAAKIVASKNRSALRAEPSSRQRATALIRSGFSEQPGVQALNAALGRGGSLPSTDRASLAMAPVAVMIPPAPTASIAASPASPYSRAREIQAQIAANEKEQRKFGFTNERNQKHGELSRQLKAEMKKLRPQ